MKPSFHTCFEIKKQKLNFSFYCLGYEFTIIFSILSDNLHSDHDVLEYWSIY